MNFYDDLKRYSSRTAVIIDGVEPISYRSLLIAADNLGAQIKRRSLVFVVCRNCYESIVGYLGLLRAQAAVVLLDAALNSAFLVKLLTIYRPEYIYLPMEVNLLDSQCSEVYSFGGYRLLKTNYAIDYPLFDDLALLLTTSGSTGSPKLVRQSYKNINSNVASIAQYLKISANDRPITTMPMSYAYGLSIINGHLLQGATLVLTETTLMERKFWEMMKTYEVTTFGGVPYTYEILKKLRFSRMDLPALQYITQAGGKLAPKLVKEFADICNEKKMKFYVMYGQTEATARMAYLPWEQARLRSDSIGIAIPGGEFWLEDDLRNVIVNDDTIGELVYRGDNVTLGYAEDRYALARNDENRGILRTGDLAKRDSEGFYYIVGRKNRFLKIFGNRINLDEVEQIVNGMGYDCACTGIDDCLTIHVTNVSGNELNQLKRKIADLIGINQSGIVFVAIDKIPRNSSGKVLYSALNKR